MDFLPKIKIEAVVAENVVQDALAAVSPITDAIRIRTDERGEKAV